MNHPVHNAFREAQQAAGAALSSRSDILDLLDLDGPPASRYLARFHCRGLRCPDGRVSVAECFDIGIHFHEDYLLTPFDAARVLHCLRPTDIFSPHVLGPFICIGRFPPGRPLPDLLYQIYEILTFQRVNPREDDALNPAACAWVRNNRQRLPTDRRPLCWRAGRDARASAS